MYVSARVCACPRVCSRVLSIEGDLFFNEISIQVPPKENDTPVEIPMFASITLGFPPKEKHDQIWYDPE